MDLKSIAPRTGKTVEISGQTFTIRSLTMKAFAALDERFPDQFGKLVATGDRLKYSGLTGAIVAQCIDPDDAAATEKSYADLPLNAALDLFDRCMKESFGPFDDAASSSANSSMPPAGSAAAAQPQAAS